MKRILTGDRPTGSLHLGHYVGSLKNRVILQDEYECFFIIADLHTLTTKASIDDIKDIYSHSYSLVLDSLACGIDPEKSCFYLQSLIPEIHEIYTLLQNLVTIPRLSRIPSIKDMQENSKLGEMPFSLLGYPVLQSADILCVRSHLVPVGKDNASHLEITREIAQRFNHSYEEIFPLPETLLSDAPSLVGIDGQAKMSKSLNNAVYLKDSSFDVEKKVMRMFTDPKRIRPDIPGETEKNPVFVYHRLFNENKIEVAELTKLYQAGQIGDVDVKKRLFVAIEAFLEPIRERRKEFAGDSKKNQ